MRRHLTLTLTLLFVVASAAAAGIASAGASTSKAQVTPHVVVKIASGTACKPAATFCFKPALKTIARGTRVIFSNTTIAPHTVTRCDALHCSGVSGGTGTQTWVGSGTIASGTKYGFTFKKPGTYVYYCMIHGYALMHGTITVT